MTKLVTFITKPVQVEAMQFLSYHDIQSIHSWCRDVYPVPAGYEHPLRRGNEHDHSNGHVLGEARAFLVLRDSNGVEGAIDRIDITDWIVRGSDGFFCRVTNDEMKQLYQEGPA